MIAENSPKRASVRTPEVGVSGCARTADALALFVTPRQRHIPKTAWTWTRDARNTRPSADASSGQNGSGNTAENHAVFATDLYVTGVDLSIAGDDLSITKIDPLNVLDFPPSSLFFLLESRFISLVVYFWFYVSL